MKPTATFQPTQGFSLIELLIVMAIIGMLAALVGPTLIKQLGKNRPKAAAAQISLFEQSLDTHKLDTGKYPKSLDGLLTNTTGQQTWNGPYLKKGLPKDPWGNEYQYHLPGRHNNDYDLFSFGADGKEGGAEEDADVVNWK